MEETKPNITKEKHYNSKQTLKNAKPSFVAFDNL